MNNTIPELSDEQIDSMRLVIKNDVDKLARAKTRRYRQAVVGAAAIVAFASVGTTAVQSIDLNSDTVGIASQSDDAGSSSGSESGGDESRLSDLSDQDSAADQKATPEGALDPGTAKPGAVAEDPAREIVTTGSVGMSADAPVDAAAKISTYVIAAGGRVDSRSETASKDDDGGRVHLVIRIPQPKVEDTVEELRGLGTVGHVNIDDHDATTEGKDLDARIKALQVSVDRLSDLMAKADSTNELIRAESALTQRQAELDSLVSQRKGLTDRVSLSSIEINITAKSSASSPSASGFRGGFVDGWNALVSTFEGAVHGFGVILPWLVALSVLAGLTWLVTRRRRTV